jgi:hypothetical protein
MEKEQSCFISVTLKSWSGRKILDPPCGWFGGVAAYMRGGLTNFLR